jgi:hypothetical protein
MHVLLPTVTAQVENQSSSPDALRLDVTVEEVNLGALDGFRMKTFAHHVL